MSGVECVPEETPPYASVIFIELHRNTSTIDEKDGYYVTFSYNGKRQNVGGVCDQEMRCEYGVFSEFLKSKEIDGELKSACAPPGNQDKKTQRWWWIVAFIFVAVLLLVVVIQLRKQCVKWLRKSKIESGVEYSKLEDN